MPPEESNKKYDIRAHPAQAYVLKLYCKDDGTEMVKLPKVSLMSPPLFTYECPKCQEVIRSKESYPKVIFDVDDDNWTSEEDLGK